VFDLPDHAIFLQTYACGMAKICGHGRLCASLNLGVGYIKASISFQLPCSAHQLSSLPHSLDNGLANLCGRSRRRTSMILLCCNSGNSTGSGQSSGWPCRPKKSMGGSSLPAPPIVAKRARTAAKLWVFGWPRSLNAIGEPPIPHPVCRQSSTRSRNRRLCDCNWNFAARMFCSFSPTVIHL